MQLSAIVNGTEYSLSDGTYAYRLEDDGTGIAPMHRLTERGPFQHGETDLGYRLDPRLIRLVLGIEGADRSARDTKRGRLMRLFKPANQVSLKWTLDNGEIRQIDCYYAGDLTAPSTDRIAEIQKLGVSFTAPDPAFYDPEPLTAFVYQDDDLPLTGASSGTLSAPGLIVPMPVPFGVSSGIMAETHYLSYAGDWLDYPIITINGPIINPIITSETTGDILDLTGVSLSAGDAVTVDCRYGYKSIVHSDGTNLIANLSTDSDLATFHIAPVDGLDDTKINIITVSGGMVNANTRIDIACYNRYTGI